MSNAHHPPLLLSKSFMENLLSPNLYKAIRFDTTDESVLNLSLPEKHYFLFQILSSVRIDFNTMLNVFVSIPTLSIEQISSLNKTFESAERRVLGALYNHLNRSDFATAGRYFKAEYDSLAKIKDARIKVIAKLKLEFGVVIDTSDYMKYIGAMNADFHKRQHEDFFQKKAYRTRSLKKFQRARYKHGQGFFLVDKNTLAKRTEARCFIESGGLSLKVRRSNKTAVSDINYTKPIDLTLPPYLESVLFKRGVSQANKKLLSMLLLESLSRNKDSKIELFSSLKKLKRRKVYDLIKTLLWEEKKLKLSILESLEGDNFNESLGFYKELFDRRTQVEREAAEIVIALKRRSNLMRMCVRNDESF